jgi:hypothetical protein
LVILVPGMIQPSGSGSSRAVEVVEASEVAETNEANDAVEVLRPGQSLEDVKSHQGY